MIENSEHFFTGKLAQWDSLGEVMIPEPWIPVWYPHPQDASPGILVRPAYYREHNLGFDGNPCLAVRTTYATHSGGILIGPLTYPTGAKVRFTMAVNQITNPDNDGAGSFSALFAREAYCEELSGFNVVYGSSIYRPYTDFELAWVDFVSDGEPVWFGGMAHWKWRSSLCCTLYGKAEIRVETEEKPPIHIQRIEIPLGFGVVVVQYIPATDDEDDSP